MVRAGLVALLLCGCVSLIPPNTPTPSETCRYYDDAHLAWYAVSIASGGLAGATGAGGVLTSTLADEPYADLGLAVASAVFGVLATVGSVLAGEYADRYNSRCIEVPDGDAGEQPETDDESDP